MKNAIVQRILNLKKAILEKIESIKIKYKHSESHTMFILDFILSSRLMIIIFVCILMLKTMLFYRNIDLDIDHFGNLSFISLQFILIMVIPIFFVKKDKNRFWIILLYDLILGTILFADNMYYEYSASMVSISQIAYLKYSEEIRRNTSALTRIKYITLFYRYTYTYFSLEFSKEKM